MCVWGGKTTLPHSHPFDIGYLTPFLLSSDQGLKSPLSFLEEAVNGDPFLFWAETDALSKLSPGSEWVSISNLGKTFTRGDSAFLAKFPLYIPL